MKRVLLWIFLLGVFITCHKVDKATIYPKLDVDLSLMNIPSVFNVFKKIEIIPLETTESSLIGVLGQVVFYNNHYYVSDRRIDSFLCFDEDGKFVRKIGKSGQGPEEYISASPSYIINPYNNTFEILSSWGDFYYVYELSGKFVEKVKLPNSGTIYHNMILLNDSIRILHSSTARNGQDQFYVYSNLSNTIVNSFYQENPNLFFIANLKFHVYNNNIFFQRPLKSSVLKVDQDGYEVAYVWDFGAMNPENTQFDKDITHEKMKEMFDDSRIKGVFTSHFQNDIYYYTSFVGINQQDKTRRRVVNVLYGKQDKKVYVFDTFKENLHFYPIFWCNEYVLSFTQPYDANIFLNPSVLNEENRKKLAAIKEDDNPFLIKYYFK